MGVRRTVRWAYYIFVFSLCLETISIGVPIEPTSIAGVLLLLATLTQPGIFFRRLPAAFYFFALYFFLCLTLALLQADPHHDEVIRYLFVFFQLIVLCWISYNLMLFDHVARTALLVFASSCLILALLQVSGIAVKTPEIATKAHRITALGFHPNNIARIFALGLLVLIGFTYGQDKKALRPRWLVLPLCASLGIAIIQTASRGGLLALGAGLLVFTLTGKRAAVRIRNALVVLLALGFIIFFSYHSETTKSRFERTLEEGELARRERIYPMAWQMFLEKPVFGWSPVASSYELGSRLRHRLEPSKNAHNLILELLVVTGLVGAALMLTGTGLAIRAAWKTRQSAHGILPFALLATVLVANMSGLWHFNKLHWIVIAYALASVNYPVATNAQRRIPQPSLARTRLRPLLAGSKRLQESPMIR